MCIFVYQYFRTKELWYSCKKVKQTSLCHIKNYKIFKIYGLQKLKTILHWNESEHHCNFETRVVLTIIIETRVVLTIIEWVLVNLL